MFKNYFKTAWRNILHHKVYTGINVLGLVLGICACVVIYQITAYEFSFDRSHPDGDRIYRIVGEVQKSNGEKDFLNSPISDVAAFENQIPGFEAKAAFYDFGSRITIANGNNPPKEFESRIPNTYTTSTIITWPQYFDVFTYEWLEGNSKVLSQPFKVVLSEKRARLYFGNIPLSEIIGKTVTYSDSLQVSVAGIVKDWNGNTDLGYTDFISISTATHSFLKSQISTDDWTSLSPHRSMAFVKLEKGVSAEQVNKKFASFIKGHIKLPEPGASLTMRLQPLTDLHFTTDFHRGDDGDSFRKPYLPTLYALMGVALFILIIAIVNFINLSTAQSIQRAKEIGVRKVMGGRKTDIKFQFLAETFVITFFAVFISALIINPVLTLFENYIPPEIKFHPFAPSTFIFLTLVTVVTCLLSAFYPAQVLSSYLPVTSLKGMFEAKGSQKISLRKGLIVFQFTVSLIFIIGVLTIAKQINFMRIADKGFNTDAIITINQWGDREGKLGVFAEEVKHVSGVSKVVWQGHAPMGFAQSIDNYKYKGQKEINLQVSAQIGNEDFIPFYQMKLIAGRNMLHSDSLNEVVINETMARALGFSNPADAVGNMIYNQGRVEKGVPVVGVVADFHTGSFHEAIQPTVIENVPDRKASVAIKLTSGEKDIAALKKTLAQVETSWKKLFPETPFSYNFLNQGIAELFDQEEKTAWLMNIAMGITIFISCMGLFGLGMFTAQKRTKEIGIRKVLGATVADITAMLSKDFVVLILIALLIASPVAWYFSNQWLQDFAYRTTMSWWIFFLAGAAAIGIALLTISFQAVKAAVAKPVQSLRSE